MDTRVGGIMKNKKIIIGTSAVLLLLIGIGVYFFFFREDASSTLTLSEKKWIETGKNKVIDLGVASDVPIFNSDGKGVFLDFIQSLEKDTKLEFNKTPSNDTETVKPEYGFEITDKATKNDILLYQDNYVLVSKSGKTYHNLESLPPLAIGVLPNELKNVSIYLNNDPKFTYKTVPDVTTLLSMLDDPASGINTIAIPKNLYVQSILKNKLTILYQMTDYTKDYVIKLGKNKTLNTIFKKYYDKWEKDNYDEAYVEHFSDSYFTYKGISEKEKSSFRSKRYTYGFVVNSPFDFTYAGKLKGINKEYMSSFSKISDIEIKYQAYNNIEAMEKAFNENDLDFMFNMTSTEKYKMDTLQTVGNVEPKVAILTTLTNNKEIHSIHSLKNEKVLVIKNTKIEAYLKEQGVRVDSYATMKDLLSHKTEKSILAVNLYAYNYYLHNELSDYRLAYQFLLDKDYGYVVRDIKENKIFVEFFSFYISFENGKTPIDSAMKELLSVKDNFGFFVNILLYIGATIGVVAVCRWIIKLCMKPKEKVTSGVKKEDKLKYMDHLTSLKNRTYLNDNIAKWDESDVYPQTILIVDLNNVAYINDNYGHQEGDAVIASAANILIKNQVINSEIIRTSGNEFLIYMVGYNEKQVVSYIRKLTKEFKELAHGFGAASGYSMIVDAIKTVDDAINEATLDMRTNKEENNN